MPLALWLSLAGVLLLALVLTAYFVPSLRRFRDRAYAAAERFVFRVSGWVFWLFDFLDRVPVTISRLYFTGHPNGMLRWAVFVAWYSALFAVVAFAPPWVGVAALGWGIWSVLCIHRAWVQNEKRRSKIAKKVDPDEEKGQAGGKTAEPPAVAVQPDVTEQPAAAGARAGKAARKAEREAEQAPEHVARLAEELGRLPDLRREAVFSGLLLLLLMPLLLLTWDQAERVFDPAPPGIGGALWLVADRTYLKGPLDLLSLESLHTTIKLLPDSPAGGLIKVFEKLAYYLIFLGLLRWFHIREDVREGVMGARRDPELAVLLGHRAVRRLVYQVAELRPAPDAPATTLRDRTEPLVNSLLALGRLRDWRARDTLARWASADEHAHLLAAAPDRKAAEAFVQAVRVAAVTALGDLCAGPRRPPSDRPKLDRLKRVGGLLKDEREEAVRATGAVARLLRRLLTRDANAAVREAAAAALAQPDHEAAVTALLKRLWQAQRSAVRGDRTAGEADKVVLKRLVQSVGERLALDWGGRVPATPELRATAVALILDRVPRDPRSTRPGMMNLLKHRYLRVRNRAGSALAALGEPAGLAALLAELPHNDNPKLLVAWLNAVAVLATHWPADENPADAMRQLVAVAKRLNNSNVRLAAAEAIAAVARAKPGAITGDVTAELVWLLEEGYLQDDREVQEPLTKILANPFHSGEQAAAAKATYCFEVLADLLEFVADPNKSSGERVAAAARLQPLKDSASLAKLKRLLETDTPPAVVRHVYDVVTFMEPVVAGKTLPREAVKSLQERRVAT